MSHAILNLKGVPRFVDADTDATQAAAAMLPADAKELTLDDALQLAVRMHQDKRLVGARTLYQRILEAVPEHPDATALLGLVEHQLGRSDDGVLLLRRAIALAPGFPGFQVNLGNVLAEGGRLDEARDAYERALELAPDVPDVHSNLGVVYRALRRHDDARAAFERAIAIDPAHARAWNNLGLLHDARGELEPAMRAYVKALELVPEHGMSIYMLGMTFYKLGAIEKATEVFRQWMEREPDNPRPRHLYAACSGQGVPERCSDDYVEAEFDNFASSFERLLTERLEYRAPQLCADALAAVLGPPARALQLLDLGCGTGLCGPLVAPWAARLVGVDLSRGMLEQAVNKGVYDDLVKAELTAYLRGTPQAWDAMVCADTLCYFGDLSEVMQAAAAALRPGGVLVYTVEARDDDDAPRIQPNGRYAHGRAHLDSTAAAAGLQVRAAGRHRLRIEGNADVDGWLVTVVRPAA